MLLSFLIPVQSPQKLTFCWVSVLITIIGLINLFGRMPADAHGTASIGERDEGAAAWYRRTAAGALLVTLHRNLWPTIHEQGRSGMIR